MRTWLARVFGGRAVAADKPARIAPTVSARTVQPVKRSPAVGSRVKRPDTDIVEMGAEVLTLMDDEKRGFDPYNSGAFHRSNGWDRVIAR